MDEDQNVDCGKYVSGGNFITYTFLDIEELCSEGGGARRLRM
jgi:hypothetical protein